MAIQNFVTLATVLALMTTVVALDTLEHHHENTSAMIEEFSRCRYDEDCPDCRHGYVQNCHRENAYQSYGKCRCVLIPNFCNFDQDCIDNFPCVEGKVGTCKHGVNSHIGNCNCEYLPNRCHFDSDCLPCKKGSKPICLPSNGTESAGTCHCRLEPGNCMAKEDCPQNCPVGQQTACKYVMNHGMCLCVPAPGYCNHADQCPECPPGEKQRCNHEVDGRVGKCECVLLPGKCRVDTDCHHISCPDGEFPTCSYLDGKLFGTCTCDRFPKPNYCVKDTECSCELGREPHCKKDPGCVVGVCKCLPIVPPAPYCKTTKDCKSYCYPKLPFCHKGGFHCKIGKCRCLSIWPLPKEHLLPESNVIINSPNGDSPDN